MPVQQNTVPVQQILVPVQQNAVPVQQNTVNSLPEGPAAVGAALKIITGHGPAQGHCERSELRDEHATETPKYKTGAARKIRT